MAEWSTGDWHEDRVALYEDGGDTLVCWLQKQGGVETKDIRLIESAPVLLKAAGELLDNIGRFGLVDESGSALEVIHESIVALSRAVNKAERGAR